ncbi:MAG: hypothetical protein HYS88_00210 [Candidatus Colwellbacteria bacterium]|nr:hypothetical protein [Candidatus Colwellbacteria bacterium]
MLIFLYGPDSYRRIQKLNEIVETFRKRQSNLSHERFDLNNEEEFLKFQIFASNQSIFNPVRLAVLDGFAKLPASNLKELKAILKTNHKNEDLIIVLNSTNKPIGFTALSKTPTKVQDFPALKGAEITAFIKKTSKDFGLTLDSQTTKTLIRTFGSSTWGIATELERMALTRADSSISIHKPDDNFFPLVNAIKYGRRLQDRLVALEILLSDRKEEPAKVFNMLAYRLRSEEEANLLADYDIAVKSGKLEYEEVLLDYVLS